MNTKSLSEAEILEILDNRKKLDVLFKGICRIRKQRPEDVQSNHRQRELVETRCVFSALARDLSTVTLWQIGALICKKHSTVIYQIRQCSDVKQIHDLYLKMRHELDSENLNYSI